ncbi:MAG: TIGR04222 domain-containing membrane protein [Bacteroidota bacterium]|nr:TIGR04222 domain-containing membrane protein [Bacteroidota bacterium]
MNSLFENPLAQMYGPAFLVFYGLVSIALILFVRYRVPALISKPKKAKNDFILPAQPDPYEVAYIRGAERELILLTVYNLVRRGYFALVVNQTQTKVSVKKKIREAEPGVLNGYEKVLFDGLHADKQLNKFVVDIEKNELFKAQCRQLERKLSLDKYIWSVTEYTRFDLIKVIAGAFLLLLAFYKIIAAYTHGHSNFGFLIIMAIFSCIFISRVKVDFHASSKGEDLLRQLKSTFKAVSGPKLQEQPLYFQQLLLAVYGFILLRYSNFAFLHVYFSNELTSQSAIYFERNSSFGNSSGGGSSCSSSSSCSGGSCGGGGGCGGCGS